jgi:hypothetical protein
MVNMRPFDCNLYPNTDMREKAMEVIKEEDKKVKKQESRWKRLS